MRSEQGPARLRSLQETPYLFMRSAWFTRPLSSLSSSRSHAALTYEFSCLWRPPRSPPPPWAPRHAVLAAVACQRERGTAASSLVGGATCCRPADASASTIGPALQPLLAGRYRCQCRPDLPTFTQCGRTTAPLDSPTPHGRAAMTAIVQCFRMRGPGSRSGDWALPVLVEPYE